MDPGLRIDENRAVVGLDEGQLRALLADYGLGLADVARHRRLEWTQIRDATAPGVDDIAALQH